MAGLTVSIEKYARLLSLDVLGYCAFIASQVVIFIQFRGPNVDFPAIANAVPQKRQ
jgi:hypothetical protein